jgi:hypothetical protein
MNFIQDLLERMFGSTHDDASSPPATPIFDANNHLITFYAKHVRLGRARHVALAERRESCLNLLEDGLRRLGDKRHREYRSYVRVFNQGSYAMHTLNQHPKKEYDIDVAVIFKEEDLPTTSLRARQRVADALRASLNNFATKPLARTNAVTAWYDEGQHVDLAVYRKVTDSSGLSYLEHAGPTWRQRDPREISRWFFAHDKALSPKRVLGASVGKGQFRRVVRLVKAFARSRLSWQLPGGLILSTLVAEVYQPDPDRDDVAFYKTLVALQSRLKKTPKVHYPVPPGNAFTDKPEVAAQVGRLLEKLDFVLPHLEILKKPACLQSEALRAWDWVFYHSYWREKARQAELAELIEPEVLQIRVGLADHENGPIKSNRRGVNVVVSKGTWLRFSLRRRLDIESPFIVRWEIRNHEDVAIRAEDRRQEHVGNETTHWQEASHEGRHSVICKIIKDGKVLARGIRPIRVTSA